MKKIIIAICMLALSMVLGGCTATVNDPAEAFKGENPQQILKAGKDYLQGSNYAEALKRFEALDVQYPFSKEAEKAQLYLIYTYYMKEEYPLAVVATERYMRIHPTSAHVDYAYFMRGLAYY